VLRLGVKVVSISGAKGKKIIEARQWKSQPYRQARAERSASESLVFTLKEGFEFGEMVRRTHENVLAVMLEKVLAYNISQIIRVRKKLSELQEMQRAAAQLRPMTPVRDRERERTMPSRVGQRMAALT
jgi:hypothetical protein